MDETNGSTINKNVEFFVIFIAMDISDEDIQGQILASVVKSKKFIYIRQIFHN